MCGIIGLAYQDPEKHVSQALVDGLTILQHRGQDAAGIVTSHNNRLNLRKSTGTVAEVFTQENVVNLVGNIGIGHVRYPTAGSSCTAEAQPLYTNFPFGIALAHNGNLTNTDELLFGMRNSHRHINTDSDSELLLNVFADELQRREISVMTVDDIFDSVRIVMRKCKGAYAVVILINGIGLLAFRDPNGIRPLCYGTRKTTKKVVVDHSFKSNRAVSSSQLSNSNSNVNLSDLKSKSTTMEEVVFIDYAIASESVAIDALDPQFKLERDVMGGEAIFISVAGDFHQRSFYPHNSFTPCLFEYVYFARPDSILDGVQVYEARGLMGEKLARKILSTFADHDIDTVIPIPETSRTAALLCAQVLNRPYREGFIKNRYIARTFIMPGQEMRRKTVRLKLNAVKSEFKDKVVLLVDDSIVRGTTSVELIQMARDAGAKKVYFASAAPPVRFPNVYGIDIPTTTELIAHNRSEDEVEKVMGADRVVYNDLQDVVDAIAQLNPKLLKKFEASCFDGVYVTEEVTTEYLAALDLNRGVGRTGSATVAVPETNNNKRLMECPPSPSPRYAHSLGLLLSNSGDIPSEEEGSRVDPQLEPITPSTSSQSLLQHSTTSPFNRSRKSGICETLHNNSSGGL